MTIEQALAAEFSLAPHLVKNTVALLDEGNTVPFIARYRKEATGEMDDQLLRRLADRLGYLRGLEERKNEVAAAIDGQGKLTEEITAALATAKTLAEVEDIYRPYKQKRKTRASVAKARGLEPLAAAIFEQSKTASPAALAAPFVNEDLEVATVEDALAGASDIIAENISDDAAIRARLRIFYKNTAMLTAKAAKEEDSVYANYYSYGEPLTRTQGHRVLAIDRGEREGFLKAAIVADAEKATELICAAQVKNDSPCGSFVAAAAKDAYTRLIHPSLEREMRSDLTDAATEGAITVFAQNLRQLLLQPPIKGKVALGLDPGYRMGCKVAVVDATGKVLDTTVVYPVPEFKRVDEAKRTVKALIQKHGVEIVAIGNGTASKETELFCAEVLAELACGAAYMVVSEAGASVYSATELAAKEFPQYDVNLRSAISIARRLQDPLAELVKIPPEAVGVGQYQHDMPKARMGETLNGVVEGCVNSVGVDLNTASPSLLQNVAGITAATAKNIVEKREADGAFTARSQLLKVKGLGPKAFTQCAGFLRVPGAKHMLDTTAVHPESYAAAETLLKLCGFNEKDIGTPALQTLPEKVREYGEEKAAAACNVGLPTLKDIVSELVRPGRDMREDLPPPLLRTDILSMEDLKPGMEITGTVRNVVDFGAFVDIGVHQDGLVHISQISKQYIKHPSAVLAVGDIVKVYVISVEMAKKRIALTMLPPAEKIET